MRTSLHRPTCRRTGYTLIEMIVSLGAASVLMTGLGSAVFLSTQAFNATDTSDARRVSAAEIQRQVLNDLRYARTILVRGSDRVTFTVPDRTGDGRPDTIAYDWSGGAGSSLTYSLNGATPVALADSVENFTLTYRTQTLVAPVILADFANAKVLYLSDGKSVDSYRIARMKEMGFEVQEVLRSASDSEIADALSVAEVVYISGELNAGEINKQIYYSTLGVVNESKDAGDEFGFFKDTNDVDGTSLRVVTHDHVITSSLTTDNVTIATDKVKRLRVKDEYAPDLQALATESEEDYPSLLALNAGAAMYGSGTTPGRRVQLPFGFGGMDPTRLTSDAWMVVTDAIRWAAGAGDDGKPNVDQPFDGDFGNQKLFDVDLKYKEKQVATKVSLAQPGTLESLAIYIGGDSSGLGRVAIYSDSGGEPGTLLGQSSVMTLNKWRTWRTFSMAPVSLSAGTYWLAYATNTDKLLSRVGDVSGSEIRILNRNPLYDGFVTNWGNSDTSLSGKAISFSGTLSTGP